MQVPAVVQRIIHTTIQLVTELITQPITLRLEEFSLIPHRMALVIILMVVQILQMDLISALPTTLPAIAALEVHKITKPILPMMDLANTIAIIRRMATQLIT